MTRVLHDFSKQNPDLFAELEALCAAKQSGDEFTRDASAEHTRRGLLALIHDNDYEKNCPREP